MEEGGPACRVSVSIHEWLMAPGVLILVLARDPATLGVAVLSRLAAEEHRQRGRRGRGVQEPEDWGEEAGHWSQGRGADLARAEAPVPPPTGLAQSGALALGPQFLPSRGRIMKELLECSSWAEHWRPMTPIHPIHL